MVYDHKAKSYLLTKTFQPCFPQDYIEWLKDNAHDVSTICSMQLLEVNSTIQSINPNIFRVINRAKKKNEPIMILYADFKRSSVTQRIICPHHIIVTSIRWRLS